MVATLVMPVSLQTEVYDMWITFDVFYCAASILYLVAISVNLYWAVINTDFVRNIEVPKIFYRLVRLFI